METKTIHERARNTIERSFKQMGLSLDVTRLVIDVMDREFSQERTYDPATQVVVSREMAKWLYEKLKWEPTDDENDMTDPANIVSAELCTALEEK